jgi:hypothetical protein
VARSERMLISPRPPMACSLSLPETTRMFWLMSPSAPKAAVARTLLDFAFVPGTD